MKIAFIGIGKVGLALAVNLEKKGHRILIGHANPKSKSVLHAMERLIDAKVSDIQSAVDQSDIVFLATPFSLNQSILVPIHFGGRTLVDCTNPVGPGISHGLESKVSGSEKVAEWAGDANVVKSYTIYGYENLENPVFPAYDVNPAMLIAGDSAEAKSQVTFLNGDLGFETIDVGGLDQSLHLEHMTLMWVKMVRANGHHPNFTWGYLERK